MSELISKIQIRRGNFADLPTLDEAELGYAMDVQRLFIGNKRHDVATADGNTTSFQLPSTSINIDSQTITAPRVFVDGQQANVNDFTLGGTVITFAEAPANGALIQIEFNTELQLRDAAFVPTTLTLSPTSPVGTTTAFQFDHTVYDTTFIEYSIKTADNKFRSGTIRILCNGENAPNSDFNMDDNFLALGGEPDITFGGDITNNIFTLTYESNEVQDATLYYNFKQWKM